MAYAQLIFATKKLKRAIAHPNIYYRASMGLIGESGCGKSTTASMILGLLEPSSGIVELFGENLYNITRKDLRLFRKDIQIIFQYTSDILDPQMTIEALLTEPLGIHKIVTKSEMSGEVDRLLGLVGLSDKEKNKFPYQLSGGQVQRILIARAIATRPKLIVCDEPVSALDVSVQGQILNLLKKLKKELDLTYIFISHDLKVIRHICEDVSVMYKGKIIESGQTKDVFECPKHQHTIDLMESVL